MTSVRNPPSSRSSNAVVSISKGRAGRWDTFGRKMTVAGVNAFESTSTCVDGVADRKNALPPLLKQCEDARAGVFDDAKYLPGE
jgi:hypothetical protein